MRVAVLDDSHDAYDRTDGIPRLREHAEVSIFTASFGDAAALRGFDALVANRERTRFNRELLQRLPDVRIIAQTGNHARHIDLVAAAAHHILVARASGGFSVGTAELAIGLALNRRGVCSLRRGLRRAARVSNRQTGATFHCVRPR